MENPSKRTDLQNKSIHLWFRQLGETLNEAGYEQKITIGGDVPWTEWSVKVVFVKIAKAMYGKIHTSDLTTKELTEVSEVLNRLLGDEGIHIPFPSLDSITMEELKGN